MLIQKEKYEVGDRILIKRDVPTPPKGYSELPDHLLGTEQVIERVINSTETFKYDVKDINPIIYHNEIKGCIVEDQTLPDDPIWHL